MQVTVTQPTGKMRHLAPFILLSLLLHVVLSFVIRPPAQDISVAAPQPMRVYFSTPAVPEPVDTPSKAPGKNKNISASLPPPVTNKITPSAPQFEATPSTNTSPALTSQQLLESAKNIARGDAIKTEQGIAALEKNKLNTPARSLQQYPQQPYQEMRLPNGTIKIITALGALCFQPVPHFAQDQKPLYGIPTTCP